MAYDYPEEFFAPAPIAVSRAAAGATPSSRARRRVLRSAKRPLLVAGGGVLYGLRHRRAARVRRDARRAGRRNAGRQGRAALGPSAAAGRDRRDRLAGRQRARARRRCGARGRHAPAGFHHRLAFAVRAGAKLVNLNVNAFDALQVARRRAASPTRGSGSTRCRRRCAHWRADAAWQDRGARRRRATGARDVARITGRRDVELPYDGDVIGAVQRSAADSTDARHRRLRRRHAARRAAQALAHVRRPAATTWNTATRAWATRSPAASASRWRRPEREVDRDRRRRQLPDAQLRDRDLGDARAEARHRRARQPRLRLHQPAAAGVRRRAVQQPVRRLRAGPAAARRASTSPRTRRRSARSPRT